MTDNRKNNEVNIYIKRKVDLFLICWRESLVFYSPGAAKSLGLARLTKYRMFYSSQSPG